MSVIARYLLLIGLSFVVVACTRPKAPSVMEYTAPTSTPAPTAIVSSAPDTETVLAELGNFTIFLELLAESGLLAEINETSLTVMAPTDEAFRRFAEETTSLEQLRADPELLRQNLRYHLIPGTMSLDELLATQEIPTLQGSLLTVILDAAMPRVNNAFVESVDLETRTGLIHSLDTVLTRTAWPPADPPADLEPDVAGWIPYEQGQPLPINDAELVPGHPRMQEAVRSLAELLRQRETEINLARTVRLQENGETKYLAPRIDPFYDLAVQSRQPVVIGILTVAGEQENEVEPGAYALTLTYMGQGEWNYQLYNSAGYAVNDLLPVMVVEEFEADNEVPVAGLYYGTVFCKVSLLSLCVCAPCGPFFRNTFATRNACLAACEGQE